MLDSVEVTSRVGDILNAHKGMEGSLLPILHAIQAEFGYVPQAALPIIAQDLNLSKAEVHGVMSFYHDFRENPAGQHVLKLCRAEACQAMGGDRVAAYAQKALGLDWHETSADGAARLFMISSQRENWVTRPHMRSVVSGFRRQDGRATGVAASTQGV